MFLENLRLVIEEADLQEMTATWIPADAPVKEIIIKIKPGSLLIGGEMQVSIPIPFMGDKNISVPFQAAWIPSMQGRLLCLMLKELDANLSGIPLPLKIFRGRALSMIAKQVQTLDGFSMEGEQLLIDLDTILKKKGIPITTNLSSILCEQDRLIILADKR